MDDKRLDNIAASVYLRLILDYRTTGIGNITDSGKVVSQKAIDIFQERLQHFIIKLKEK